MSKGRAEKSPAVSSCDGGGGEVDFDAVALMEEEEENLLRFSWSFEKGREVNRDPSDGHGHVLCFIFFFSFSDERPPRRFFSRGVKRGK